MTGQELEPYRLQARNDANEAENKIHDDAVARDYGFAGGLVPGVTVWGYMTHPVVEALGRDWLERGTAAVRFSKPVYDGETVTVQTVVAQTGEGSVLELCLTNESDDICAQATASLPPQRQSAPDSSEYPRAPLPSPRPPASSETLRPGAVLGSVESSYGDAETVGDEGVVHPGRLLRCANHILTSNVRLGPWVHVESRIANLGLAHVGDQVTTRGRVAEAFEKKGHKFVRLDVLVTADDNPVMHVDHVAIYEPRRARA